MGVDKKDAEKLEEIDHLKLRLLDQTLARANAELDRAYLAAGSLARSVPTEAFAAVLMARAQRQALVDELLTSYDAMQINIDDATITRKAPAPSVPAPSETLQ